MKSKGGEPERWVMSICPYCGVGCGVEVGVRDGRIMKVKGMRGNPANLGELCHLGMALKDMPEKERLLYPMIRRDGVLRRASFKEAIDTVAERLMETISMYGPDSVAMYISASEYIEEYYVYNKFMKGCIGTNNIDSSARLCWASGVMGIVGAFGQDSPPCTYGDIELADMFFITGYNMVVSKPVLSRRIARTKRKNRATIVVVDPRRTPTARMADIHLRIRPGTDILLHNGLARVMMDEGLIDEDEARGLVHNYDEFRAHIEKVDMDGVAMTTGLDVEEIERTARAIARAERVLFLWGQGLNQSTTGTGKVSTLLNIAFVTGNIGRPGCGPLAVTGQTDAMGLREVGALPHLLPGFRKVTDEEHRKEVASIWGIAPERISKSRGKTFPAILEAIDKGEIRALWIIHSNPLSTFPDTGWIKRVLEGIDFLVVQDCYHPTETTSLAHVLLPGSQWLEKEGCMTNSTRGLNLVEKALPPPGDARPDLEIVMAVARRMGYTGEFWYRNTEDIFEEYKTLTRGRPNDITGVSYRRLRKERSLQWPIPDPAHKGTERRFTDRRFPEGRLFLGIHGHTPPRESPDSDYPLLLITGIIPFHFHSGTRTGRMALSLPVREPFVRIHPVDAVRYGVTDGEYVEVASRRGTLRLRAVVTEDVMEGTVFIPYHFGYLTGWNKAVNMLTIRAYDDVSAQPEFKACAVRIRGC